MQLALIGPTVDDSLNSEPERLQLIYLQNSQSPRDLMGHFTFWISLSLSVSLSPKLGLRPTIVKPKSEVVFSFGLSDSLSVSLRVTKLRTERSLNSKLINSQVDFACTR